MSQNQKLYDAIILGSGPSGLTAAIYISRANLRALVITGNIVGGQISYTYQIDNYPGFPGGISGPELVQFMRRQAELFGADFIEEEATGVDFSSHPFRIFVGSEEYQTYSVVIATGSLNRKLGIESEDRLLGRGVFVCATCDAALYEGKKVTVVGGGDSALQEALDLAKFAGKVTIIHRKDRLSACLCLRQRSNENNKIEFIFNSEVKEIIGKEKVEGVRILNKLTGEERDIECEGVLIAIGWDPNSALFQGQLEIDEKGYVVSKTGIDTSIDGVFVCGDLNDTKYRQAITACGSGCMAAIEAERFIEKNVH